MECAAVRLTALLVHGTAEHAEILRARGAADSRRSELCH